MEVVNKKVYQNGTRLGGSGVTLVHASSLAPDKFDIDAGQAYITGCLDDSDPLNLSIPQTPYGYGGDRQFAYQWDLTIPVGQSVSFTINDTFYPTLPITAAKSHAGTCVTYGGQTAYTIVYDNIANSTEGLTNVNIIDFLPQNTAPYSMSPGGVHDSSANTVTWSLASLAAGAVQQTKTLTITVNSADRYPQ